MSSSNIASLRKFGISIVLRIYFVMDSIVKVSLNQMCPAGSTLATTLAFVHITVLLFLWGLSAIDH